MLVLLVWEYHFREELCASQLLWLLAEMQPQSVRLVFFHGYQDVRHCLMPAREKGEARVHLLFSIKAFSSCHVVQSSPIRIQGVHVHFVLRQRASFIGTDKSHRAQRFYGW